MDHKEYLTAFHRGCRRSLAFGAFVWDFFRRPALSFVLGCGSTAMGRWYCTGLRLESLSPNESLSRNSLPDTLISRWHNDLAKVSTRLYNTNLDLKSKNRP